MRQFIFLKSIFVLLLALPLSVSAQRYTLDNETSFLQVLGTSSLHDWHVQAEKQSGTLVFSDVKKGQISSIVFSVVSESLKSGKSGMDKKTFKALKTDTYSSIDYTFTEAVSVTQKEKNSFLIEAKGNLTICGITKPITHVFEVTLKDQIVVIDGSYKLLMTEFGISPPKALLGTIKTGDEIEIKFKTIFSN